MKIPVVGTGTAVYDILLKLTGFPVEDEAVGSVYTVSVNIALLGTDFSNL